MLRIVTGEVAPVRGHGELRMGVGGLIMPHEMWVAEIIDECILHLDFLEKHGCQVDLRENVLVLDGEVALNKPVRGVTLVCCRVVAKGSCHSGPTV